MRKLKHFLTVALLIFLGACSYRNPLSDMGFQAITAPPHIIASWYRIDMPGAPLRIYIEGNVSSFTSDGKPTSNPTPTNEFMRKLAADDPNSNIAYLGLPCQYLQISCTSADWTTDLLSDRNIQSMDTAVLSLMKKANTDKAVLIGYLDSVSIAKAISARHPDKIMRVISVPTQDVNPEKIYEADK